ncbi:MAG: tyrosine-type recombinase/integrase, partial [Streptosporangiaceae bacterium]
MSGETSGISVVEADEKAVARDNDGLHRRGRKWYFTLRIGGKWREFATGTASYQEARGVKRQTIKQQIEGRLPSDVARWQLPKALEEWRKKRAHTIAPNTVSYYLRHCQRLADGLGSITLGAITADVVASYQQKRLAAGVSPRTVNMEVGTLRSVMIRARLWANIAPDVHMLPEPASPGVAITRQQEEQLLAACAASRSPSLHTFIVLAIETGARRGVIQTLQWKRVDFGNRCLTWGKDKTPAGTGRVVPLSVRALAALADWSRQFPGRQPDDYVFPTMSVGGSGRRGLQGARQDACFVGGVAYDVDPARPIGDVTSAWEAARKRAGLQIRIHDCRHLAASRMLDAGVPIAKVARILG